MSRDLNLLGYVGCRVTIATDPSGLREFRVEIIYFFSEIRLTDAVRGEVDRLLQDVFAKSAKPEHSLAINWTAAANEREFDQQRFGWIGGSLFLRRNPDGVRLGLRDTLKLDVPGQGGGFKANLNLGRIHDAAQDAGKQFDISLATVIAHELFIHAIGKRGHWHQKGWVDAKIGKVGGVFSPEACRWIADRIDVD